MVGPAAVLLLFLVQGCLAEHGTVFDACAFFASASQVKMAGFFLGPRGPRAIDFTNPDSRPSGQRSLSEDPPLYVLKG